MPTTADYAGAQTLMFTGKSAFYLQGEWEITTAQGIEGLKFGMVPFPSYLDKQARAGRLAHVRAAEMDRTPEQMKRAMGFIKSMLDQSMTWAKGGHIPAYLPTLQQPRVQGADARRPTTPRRPTTVSTTRRPGTPARGPPSRPSSAPRSAWSSRAWPARLAPVSDMKSQLRRIATRASPL